MATLYINKYETVSLFENHSEGIGWSFVADDVYADEWMDLVVGETRHVITYTAIDVDESVTIAVVFCAKLDMHLPVRQLSAYGYYRAEGSEFLRTPARELEASGGIQLNEVLPVRRFSGEVIPTYPAVLSEKIPARTLVAYTGAEQVDGLIPVRTISGTVYFGQAWLEGYVPVRELEAETLVAGYATLEGSIPVRSISTSGRTEYVISLSKRRPVWYGSSTASDAVGSSGDLNELIPPRKLEAEGYWSGVEGSGDIPVWTGGSDGQVGTVSPTVADDYILVYVRP